MLSFITMLSFIILFSKFQYLSQPTKIQIRYSINILFSYLLPSLTPSCIPTLPILPQFLPFFEWVWHCFCHHQDHPHTILLLIFIHFHVDKCINNFSLINRFSNTFHPDKMPSGMCTMWWSGFDLQCPVIDYSYHRWPPLPPTTRGHSHPEPLWTPLNTPHPRHPHTPLYHTVSLYFTRDNPTHPSLYIYQNSIHPLPPPRYS